MRAWVTKLQEDGRSLDTPVPAVEGASLLEVLVVDVTEDGNRRPIKVARLMPIGQRRILAQLKMPEPVQFKEWTLVLSGFEQIRKDNGRIREVAQTWMCQLAPPDGAAGFRVAETFESGERVPKAALREGSGSRGTVVIGEQHSDTLRRRVICAELHSYKISTFPEKRLVKIFLEFMAEDMFELGGIHVRTAHGDRPLERARRGWLCRYDIPERELTKREARMLR